VFRLLAVLLLSPLALAPQKESPVVHHAHGTFTVKMEPLPAGPAEGLARFGMKKEIHSDLEGTSQGEMLAGGDFSKGAAGYVAIELVTGTLAGKQGSFALQHFATMDANGPKMTIAVVPGSGTGELKGIAGTFTITIAGGAHSYELEYSLPQ
jgi:hypothetical protein